MNKLQQLKKEACEKHEKLLAYLDRIATLAPLLDEFEKLGTGFLYAEDGCVNVSVTGDKHKLNAVFGLLRRHGMQTNTRPEAGKSSYSAFFHPEDDSLAGLGSVWLTFSSTQCRRVKTGTVTRTIQEDVFEIVCDEQEYPERAEQPAEVAEEIPF